LKEIPLSSHDGLPQPRRRWAILTVCLAIFATVTDQTIVNVALPTIGRDLGIDASSSVWEFKRQGKLEVVWSAVDETPVFTLTGGIFKDAPHPNAAKLYLTWFLAKEQQAKVGSFSSRSDVPPPEDFKPLTQNKIANNYREFMVDEKLIAELRKRMEGFTGPPVNKGGVR